MEKILFQNRFLAIVDRDGYTFSREVRCDGKIVAVLPFRRDTGRIEFLARLEVCLAHGPGLELCSITGGVDVGKSPLQMAVKELSEEAGYGVNEEALISLGQVRPSKSSDTIVHLFAVDVSEEEQSDAIGDGTPFEAGSSVQWVSYEEGIQITDPLLVTAIVRLTQLMRKG